MRANMCVYIYMCKKKKKLKNKDNKKDNIWKKKEKMNDEDNIGNTPTYIEEQVHDLLRTKSFLTKKGIKTVTAFLKCLNA